MKMIDVNDVDRAVHKVRTEKVAQAEASDTSSERSVVGESIEQRSC